MIPITAEFAGGAGGSVISTIIMLDRGSPHLVKAFVSSLIVS